MSAESFVLRPGDVPTPEQAEVIERSSRRQWGAIGEVADATAVALAERFTVWRNDVPRHVLKLRSQGAQRVLWVKLPDKTIVRVTVERLDRENPWGPV